MSHVMLMLELVKPRTTLQCNLLGQLVNIPHPYVPYSYQHLPSLPGLKEFKASCTFRPRSPGRFAIRRRELGFNEHLVSWTGARSHHSATECSSTREVGEYNVARDSMEMGGMETETFTVEEAIQAVGFGHFQGFLLFYAGMAWTAEAMEMMLLSFVGPALKDVWNLSPREESIITSVVFVGMMIGAYSWGFLSDAKGRRPGLFATSVLTFIAGLLSAFSPNYHILLLLRCLVGLGLGGGPVVSTWFMEFVPSANRGLWMIIVSLFWTLGSVLEALLAWNVMPELGWRWLLGLSSLPLAVLLLFYPFIPESPRFLASKGELKRATDVLRRMERHNKKALPSGSLASSLPLQENLKAFKQHKLQVEEQNSKDMTGSEMANDLQDPILSTEVTRTWSTSTELLVFSKFSVLLSPPVMRSTLLLWSVFFANAFTYYGLVLLSTQLSGGTGSCVIDSSVQQSAQSMVGGTLYRDVLLTSIAEIPGLAIAASIVDKYGRKRSMSAFFVLCGIFLLPLKQHQDEIFTTALLFGARASIMGAFTVLYIYAPEVYPTGLRTTGLGIANSFARIGGLLCPLVAVDLVQSCQQSLAVGLFTLVTMTAGFLVLNFPTETKGLALSDSLSEFDTME